jgi:multisubunit Na+/H+ antiporter MnhB subunit
MTFELMPDIILSILLLLMAWGALYAPTRQDAMALFVAFGLVVALIWARLGAPDLALAEAAIGAGLTGVLLMQAARLLPAESASTEHRALWFRSSLLFLLLTTAMFATLVLNDSSLELAGSGISATPTPDSPSLPQLVSASMADSGVGHPVTAVLLNFRAWDTLLELLVLLLALTGVRQLYPGMKTTQPALAATKEQTWPLLLAWSRFLAPLLVLTGGYLLWRGAEGAGGAFQAGAMLAAAAVILRLTGLLPGLSWSSLLLRLAVNIGALVFLSVALATLMFGDGWLVYPVQWSGALIIAIEVFATLSIAVTLSLLVVGEPEELSA